MKKSPIVIMFVLIYWVLVSIAGAQDYKAISLLKIVSNSRIFKSCSLGEIKGVFIADSDLILIGENDPSSPLTLDEIVLAARAGLGKSENPGVVTTQISEDSTLSFFVYLGNIGQTPVGAYMARCLRRLYLLGCGAVRVPLKGFWSYGNLPPVKLWVSPNPGRCLVSSTQKLMVLQGAGVAFNSKVVGWESVNPRIREWAAQLTERYDELAKCFPEFAEVRRFFRLYEVFLWARKNMKNDKGIRMLNQLLQGYTMASECYVPRSFRLIGKRNIAGGITCQIENLRIQGEPLLDELEDKITLALNSDPELGAWPLHFPTGQLAGSTRERTEIIAKLNSLGLYGCCTFLYLSTKGEAPKLRVFHDNVTYLRPTDTARKLVWLVKRTLKKQGNFQSYWTEFYRKELMPLVDERHFGDSKEKIMARPILVLVGDEISSEWILLQRVRVLGENFAFFLLPDKAKGFWPSIQDFLHKVDTLVKLNQENFAIVVQTCNKELNGQVYRLRKVRKILGDSNVLVDPSKKQFLNLLYNRKIRIALMQVKVTDEEIKLNGKQLSWRDILRGGKLAHLRYIILVPQGTGWGKKVLRAMQTKGAGLVSILPKRPLGDEELTRLASLVRINDGTNPIVLWLPSALATGFQGHLGWGSVPE
ncbi:MAG: hypothetical protein DRI61_12435 [Chloroflexi bacterium]|nr:MAG: hypothetical protein DRI61_12435 [Chloroflexota bacterium]